jgi:Carbohydrate esterase 2 N-terminal/GDSL-like Lipase/Acylhydrolase family
MKRLVCVFAVFQLFILSRVMYASTFVPADNPDIQYQGRWDFSDSLNPRHSWPGIFIVAVFNGDSIGVRMQDSVNYYDVYIDGKLHGIFHGDKPGDADYILADSLQDTVHTLRFSQRNISFGIYTFSGLILSSGARLFPPPELPARKIEFIGDSFTAAEGNEAKDSIMEWEAKFPVTDIDSGFAAITARHFGAQYHITARSGIGMVCDWQGKFDVSMPRYFDRTLMESSEPTWDFSKWTPDLVVICLGLNDHSGLRGKSGNISRQNSLIFRKGYAKFIATVRKNYPGVPIIAWAPYVEWARTNTRAVVRSETKNGIRNIFYAHFDEFPGGYVANGHPTVATHMKMADELISTIDSLGIFPTAR